jgi:protein TonB
MKSLSNQTSGLAATAAVHVALAALLLAGWQVTRPKPASKPIIITDIKPPVEEKRAVEPRTSDLPIVTDILQPDFEVTRPDPVIPPPIGDAGPKGPTAGNGETVQPPQLPPVASGPSRGARLIAAASMQPPYPSASRALGEEGTVELMVSIDARGVVTGVNLLRSSGFARLDAAAIAFALKRWRFEAALQDGQPVATSRRFTIRFNLAAG